MANKADPKTSVTLELTRVQTICIAVGFIVVMLPLILYFYKFGHKLSLSSDRDDWNMFGQFIGGTIGPALALLTLGVTAWIAIQFNKYQKAQQENADNAELQQTTIDLFKEFRSYQLRRARNLAWEVKKNWDDKTKTKYKEQFIDAMIKEQEDTSNQITKEQIKGVYDLFAFYIMLGLYGGNEKNIRNLNYFYYAWWRKFLYEIASAYDTSKVTDISTDTSLDDKTKFDKQEFLSNISLKRPLQTLDKLCGFDKIGTDFNL